VLFAAVSAVPRLPDAARRRPTLPLSTTFGDAMLVAISADPALLDRVAVAARAAPPR
jgi:hypothetical protein